MPDAVNNPRIEFEEQGKKEPGRTPLVLVHGFPFDHTIWRTQLEDLGKQVWVVAPDLPGFGGSAPIESAEASIEDYADRLSLWIFEQGLGTVVLVGHSMGGYVALAFARKYPEQLAGLGLVCTRAAADTDAAREGRYAQIAQVWDRGPQAVVDAMLPRLFSPRTQEKKPEIIEEVKQVMLRQRAEGIVPALQAMANRPDSTSMLGSITVPTLVVSGVDDAIMPAPEADLLASEIPGAAQVRIDSAGHMPMLENPAELSRVLLDLAMGAQSVPDVPEPPATQDIAGVRSRE